MAKKKRMAPVGERKRRVQKGYSKTPDKLKEKYFKGTRTEEEAKKGNKPRGVY